MIQKFVILILTIWVAILVTERWTFQDHHEYEPKFKGKDCFRFRVHPSEKPVGIIAYRKEEYYVVMFYKEADKRYAGPKMGNELPIKWLDEHAILAECPPEWSPKKGRR